MRGRVALWILLGCNAALTAMLLYFGSLMPESIPGIAHRLLPPGSSKSYKTNVVVRRQNFVWNQIESDDYATYIANLREIGCPEPTIRDIIVADVNQLFARRRATEVATAEQQWWKSEPDPEVAESAAEKLKTLERERRSLLSALLGPAWESSYYPYPTYPNSPPLDGPILGALSPEVKQAVHTIENRSQERRQAYLDAMRKEGKEPDPIELAKLRQQTRNELAQVLDGGKLEEYVLRYSNNANALRGELHGLTTTAEEFRSLFRITDPLDQQIQLLAGSADPADVKRRQELEQQRDTSIRQALGTDRYQQYKLMQDPVYREAQTVAQQVGANSERVLALYEINRVTEQERQRIRNDETLTAEQRTQALEEVSAAQTTSLRRLLGEEAYQRYLNSQKR
jgi:hypothetical protein